MKGHPTPEDAPLQTGHGLDCPNCDGQLVKTLASAEQRELLAGSKLRAAGSSAKYIYSCDSCDYTEEISNRDG